MRNHNTGAKAPGQYEREGEKMSEYKKSFKKLVEELASLERMDERNVSEWFSRCDMSYQYDGISYKDLEILLRIANKITTRE